jgi:hypothetical protein
MDYPRITELGLTVRAAECGLSYVDRAELREALGPKLARFNRLLGLQTAIREGVYPWDVESALERLTTGKLTGSQKEWD